MGDRERCRYRYKELLREMNPLWLRPDLELVMERKRGSGLVNAALWQQNLSLVVAQKKTNFEACQFGESKLWKVDVFTSRDCHLIGRPTSNHTALKFARFTFSIGKIWNGRESQESLQL